MGDRMTARRWWGTAASGLAVAAAGFGVASIARPGAEGEIADVLIKALNSGAVIEQYVAQLVSGVRIADRAGDGLDRRDVELLRAQQAAQARASAVSQMLGYDLNGDFQVTREEIAQVARGEEPHRTEQVQITLERFDSNGDGLLTIAEAAATAREQGGDATVEALLALDPNHDGRLTTAELRALAERAFGHVDSDGDGQISPAEYKLIKDRVHEVRMISSLPRCDLPPVPVGAKLVVYGGYESDAISSVAVGGPEQETNFIDVTIEPGATPLYVVLTSYESMVWRLSGRIDRVVRVVVSSLKTARASAVVAESRRDARRMAPARLPVSGISASGVIGIPRDKVTIARSGCPHYFSDVSGTSTRLALAPIRRELGREPDAVFGTYSARRVSLPSGAIAKAERNSAPLPPGFDAATWPDAIRFWPGGLVMVNPRQVVAASRVEPYKVLPSQMGLSQLIGAGAIERTASGAFRIVKPIAHMPPSMGGSHSVKLIVAKGVPVPPGSPGHSCVVLEGEGVASGSGPRCGLSD